MNTLYAGGVKMNEYLFEVENLNVEIDSSHILKNVAFSSKSGSIICVTGVSGIGKSTLLKTIGQILKASSGHISLNGKKLDNRALNIGYVPQDHGLYSWLKVKGNIVLPCKIKKIQTDQTHYLEIVNKLGISNITNRYPANLSGGEKQRVSLARGMILNPDILLMDEAFSSLDTFSKLAAYELFLSLHKKFKPTTLLITHDLDEAIYLADTIVILTHDKCLQFDNIAKVIKKSENNYEYFYNQISSLIKGENINEKLY
jgi:NitT/TauT family transport system ATP-binding protein